jgi:hypothetical protein
VTNGWSGSCLGAREVARSRSGGWSGSWSWSRSCGWGLSKYGAWRAVRSGSGGMCLRLCESGSWSTGRHCTESWSGWL